MSEFTERVPRQNKIYEYKGRIYVVIRELEIKCEVTGKWYEGVLYTDGSGVLYARGADAFYSKFTLAIKGSEE